MRQYILAYRQNNPQYPFEFWLPEAGFGIPPEEVLDPAEVFLLEGFIAGQQVSVDGFVADGRVTCLGVIEIERIGNSQYFLEYEEWMPTRLGTAAEERIAAAATRAVGALGLRNSCFHCELKVAGDRIQWVELFRMLRAAGYAGAINFEPGGMPRHANTLEAVAAVPERIVRLEAESRRGGERG